MQMIIYHRPGSKPKCGDNKTETQVSPKCAISNLHTFDKVFVENSTQVIIPVDLLIFLY